MFNPRPRTQNVFIRDHKPLVAKVPHLNGDYLPASIDQALRLLGGLDKAIHPGDRVMLKPNFNCSFALPHSTDLAFLAASIEILQDAGARVTVGELSGRAAWPTHKVIADLNVMPMLRRYGVEFINFEHDNWIPLQIQGRYWNSFHVPRSIYEAHKRVYLANMRCHVSTAFTSSLKLSVGWIDLKNRELLHQDNETIEAKVAELNLGWQPDLVLTDGRRSTVAWNGRGEYVYPDVIMASGDMVAIDAEAVKILKQYSGDNKLKVPLEELGQLKTAQEHGLGTMDSIVIQAPTNTHTENHSNPKSY